MHSGHSFLVTFLLTKTEILQNSAELSFSSFSRNFELLYFGALLFFVLKTGSHVVQAGLKSAMYGGHGNIYL